MTKAQRAEKARRMLSALGEEQANGGFNEFSQFCEEGLQFLTDHLSEEGLVILMKKIEAASNLGVTRFKKLEEYSGETGVW